METRVTGHARYYILIVGKGGIPATDKKSVVHMATDGKAYDEVSMCRLLIVVRARR